MAIALSIFFVISVFLLAQLIAAFSEIKELNKALDKRCDELARSREENLKIKQRVMEIAALATGKGQK